MKTRQEIDYNDTLKQMMRYTYLAPHCFKDKSNLEKLQCLDCRYGDIEEPTQDLKHVRKFFNLTAESILLLITAKKQIIK